MLQFHKGCGRINVHTVWTIEEALTAKHNPIRGKIIFNLVVDGHLTCCKCGLVATHVVKYRQLGEPDIGRHHVDFYGDTADGAILLTKDHVLPISLGGTDRLGNLRPMCVFCNVRRGNVLDSLLLVDILSNIDNYIASGRRSEKFYKYIRKYHPTAIIGTENERAYRDTHTTFEERQSS